MTITATGASTKTANASQRTTPRRERNTYAASRLTTAAAAAMASIARLLSPAKTSRITIARPASAKLRRASQRRRPIGLAVEVVAAAVGAQAPQRHDVDGDDHQGPERVAGEEEHLADGVQADQGHPGPAGGLVAGQHPDGGQGLEHAQDQGDPAPGAQVAEQIGRASGREGGQTS